MSSSSSSSSTATEAPRGGKQSSGFVSDVILNAVEPGVNYSVVIFINIVFGLLLVTSVVLTIVTEFNTHLIFFTILTAGLMIALNM
jgi:hypothetical protein